MSVRGRCFLAGFGRISFAVGPSTCGVWTGLFGASVTCVSLRRQYFLAGFGRVSFAVGPSTCGVWAGLFGVGVT